MTTTEATPAPASAPQPAPSSAARDAWRVSWTGLWLVAQLELKQRVRSTRWKWALGIVAALFAGVTFLVWAAVNASGGDNGPGDLVFGLVVFFVLFIGLVVSPTLSATSINGDVKEGTLAPLQATALSAADIVLGKLLAAWLASLAFLAVAVPFIAIAYLDGRMPFSAMVVVLAVLAAELLLVCAMGLAWSALTSRTASSAVLTYTSVAVITVILPIIFGLLSLVVTHEVEVTNSYRTYYYEGDGRTVPDDAYRDEWGSAYTCETNTYISEQPRTDLYWWLLAANPYVIVADSAPSPGADDANAYWGDGILSSLKQGVRMLRLGSETSNDDCRPGVSEDELYRQQQLDGLSPLWPWGLAFQALLAAGSVAIAVRRTAVPYGTLPTGSRVA